MEKLDWSEKRTIEAIQAFILDDCTNIKAASKVGPVDPELAKIAGDAMIDLLCIRYHNEAKQRIKNYTLTYEELCKRI
jgi:hypothetical protein